MNYARRLQKIGSSMLVSLPSDWIKVNNLGKGSTVFLETNEDNSVSLFASGITDAKVTDVNIMYNRSYVDGVINQIELIHLFYPLIELSIFDRFYA